MNVLTFDIEEWYVEKTLYGDRKNKYTEYDCYLDAILNKLDERKQKATFFCVGEMGRLFPNVIRKIHQRGHEVGCHSNIHTWLNKMTEAECQEDTHRAIESLEQCIGERVKSYRAPAFSIGENNKWMFEILASVGITSDSSVYPAARDFGGFPAFQSQEPCTIKYAGISIKEYPISMIHFMGKQMAYSGGGYFRFFPLGFVRGRMAKSDYTMCYFHIEDLLPERGGVSSKERYEAYYKEPGTLKNRYMRYIKSNFGKKTAWSKLERLIKAEEFINIELADSMIDWGVAPVISF